MLKDAGSIPATSTAPKNHCIARGSRQFKRVPTRCGDLPNATTAVTPPTQSVLNSVLPRWDCQALGLGRSRVGDGVFEAVKMLASSESTRPSGTLGAATIARNQLTS